MTGLLIYNIFNSFALQTHHQLQPAVEALDFIFKCLKISISDPCVHILMIWHLIAQIHILIFSCIHLNMNTMSLYRSSFPMRHYCVFGQEFLGCPHIRKIIISASPLELHFIHLQNMYVSVFQAMCIFHPLHITTNFEYSITGSFIVLLVECRKSVFFRFVVIISVFNHICK